MAELSPQEKAAEEFRQMFAFFNRGSVLCELLIKQLSAMIETIHQQKEILDDFKENSLTPFINDIEGVSKIADFDTPPGVGAGDVYNCILYPNDAVASSDEIFVSDSSPLLSNVQEHNIGHGRRVVSIPDTVAKMIHEKSDDIKDIVERFYRSTKNTKKVSEFDFNMTGAVVELSNLLDIPSEEAIILFRMFVAQYLSSK